MSPIYLLTFVIGSLVVVSFNSNNADRTNIAFVSILGQIVYMLFFVGSDSPEYVYMGASVVDFVSILILSRLAYSSLLIDVMLIHIGSITAHLMGYVAYWLYINGVYYNILTLGIFIAQTIRLLYKGDDANIENNTGGILDRLSNRMVL